MPNTDSLLLRFAVTASGCRLTYRWGSDPALAVAAFGDPVPVFLSGVRAGFHVHDVYHLTLLAETGFSAVLDILRSRYRALKSSFAEAGIRPFPFNGGCFAMVPVRPGDDCDEVRMRLIREQSVGVIAVPMANALRVAFCSIDADDIPDLVRRLAPLVA